MIRNTVMNADVVRKCFEAYEKKDRELIEALLAPDFTFSSPIDDHIDRETYFARCWPNSEHILRFQLEKVIEDRDEVWVRYTGIPMEGSPSRNLEVFRVEGGLIKEVTVFFGNEDATAANAEEIQTVLEDWAGTIRRKDATALAAHFTKNPTLFYLAPPLVADEPVEENAREWFATWEGPLRYEMREVAITAEGETAFVHGLHHLTGRKTDGQTVDLWFRETLGLRKIKGRWLIVHAHESVPFLMDGSNRAALNLKPN